MSERIAVYLMAIITNLVILVGCGYAVFGLGRSPWWFLIAAAFMIGVRDPCRERS